MKKTKKNYACRKAFGRGVKVVYAKGKKACSNKKKASSSGKPKSNVLIIHRAATKDVNLSGYKYVGNVPKSKDFLVFKKNGK